MDENYQKIKLVFDIEPEFESSDFTVDDYKITINILKNKELIHSIQSPLSSPDWIFETLKDVLIGREMEVIFSLTESGSIFHTKENDKNSLKISITSSKLEKEFLYFINKNDYKNAVIDLFKKYKILLKEKIPDLTENKAFQYRYSLVKDYFNGH